MFILRCLFIAGLAATAAFGAPSLSLDEARALIKERKYPEARAALEAIVAAQPNLGAAFHQLGLVVKLRRDNASYELAVQHLARAVELEPKNATYLADFGGTSLELAGRTRAVAVATKGRDALERALQLDPNNLNAREGLFQFYRQAPWIVGGSNAKADAQLEEIRKRNPDRATGLSVLAKVGAKDYAGAFKVCDDLLARKPDDYMALYHYGRAAAISRQNLELGLARLQKCLAMEPPTPASPSHSNVWNRAGELLERLGRLPEARAAYESAVKLDPGNKPPADALKRLGPP